MSCCPGLRHLVLSTSQAMPNMLLRHTC
uniref:Uncharacterized protein n=1 Tax=Rhizophora mucronata TaxID=61149 RepID=A0A2P2IUS1_RHIMU